MANVVNKNNIWVVEQDDITISKAGITSGSSVTLDTAGKFIDRNIVVEAPSASVVDGQIAAEVSAITAGSASMSTTTMATSSTATDYYVTLNTTAGSATAKAKVSTAGYLDTTDTVTSSASSVAVTGNGSKTYIKKASYANTVENPSTYTDISTSAPALVEGGYLYINEGYSPNSKISLAKLVPDGTNIEEDDPLIYKTKTAYNNEGKKITGSMDDATIEASASNVTANITSVTPTYNTGTSKFDISGSGNITGTISAATKTTGYAVAGTTKDSKTLSGTASLSATLNKISVKATKGADGAVTPVISEATAKVDGKTKIAATPTKATTGIDTYYIAVNTAAISASTTVTPGVQSAGYGDTTNYTSTGNVTVTRGAATSGTYYIPVAKAGTSSSTSSASAAAGTNLTITDTKPSGTSGTDFYTFTVTGKGRSKITSAGYIGAGDLGEASATKDYYIAKATHTNKATITNKVDPACTYSTATPTVSNASYSISGITTSAPSGEDKVYITIAPSFSETAGSVKASASCTNTAGYCAGGDTTTNTSAASSIGITETKGSSRYIEVYTGSFS